MNLEKSELLLVPEILDLLLGLGKRIKIYLEFIMQAIIFKANKQLVRHLQEIGKSLFSYGLNSYSILTTYL